MTDQSQRLEVATVKAEVGSNILYRFANDPAANAEIPTEAGDIPNLKQVILQLQEDGAEKISFATTIYPTTAAGIAATTNGAIFLVVSNEADEIYAVYSNTAGVAVDTGKRALSSQAVEDAMLAATEAADAAQDAADIATARTARFLASVSTAPTIRDDGTPLQVGDRYVNTEDQAEYIYKSSGWEVNDSMTAIEDLRDEENPAKGAAGVGFDGDTVDSLLLNAKSLTDYSALRSYTGRATGIRITAPGIAGHIYRDPAVAADDGGITFLDGLGRGWRRHYTGNVNVSWFGSKGTYATTGIFDDLAFSLAAKASPAANNISGAAGTTTMPRAPICHVDVPDGTYGFQNTIDVANKEVTWVFSNAARILGDTQKKLNGNIERPGERITKQAYGMQGYATGFSVAVDASEYDKSPAVTGITSASAFNKIPSHDSVGMFVGNYSKPALYMTTTACVFTATTVTLPVAMTAEQILKLRRGMTVDTLHSPRWVGLLDSWSADGLTLTVSPGWYLYGGTGAGTPTNTAGVGIGGNDRVWGLNTAVRLDAGGYSYQAIGHELSVYNTLGDSTTALDVGQGRVWGQLIATGGGDSNWCQAAYIARGNWRFGFVANAGSQVGFYCETNVPVGFRYKGDGVAVSQIGPDGRENYSVQPFGNQIVGNSLTSGTRFVKYRTSGLNNGTDYDVQVSATGGGATAGGGTYRIDADSFVLAGNFLPSSTGALRELGSGSAIWNNTYSNRFRPGTAGASAPVWTSGAGSPEGVLTAAVGSMFTRTDGGPSTTLYVKESGTGSAGWVAK